jgi:hypothetical protein
MSTLRYYVLFLVSHRIPMTKIRPFSLQHRKHAIVKLVRSPPIGCGPSADSSIMSRGTPTREKPWWRCPFSQ